MTIKKEMKDTLRYKHMVADLRSRPAYAKEAALLKEIAGGKQWRMDAVLDAIEQNRTWWWQHPQRPMEQMAMFGRLATIQRYCHMMEWDAEKNRDNPTDGMLQAFHTAVIHGHYKVADYLVSIGAHPDYMSKGVNAMHVAVTEGDKRKISYLIDKGSNAGAALMSAIAWGTPATVDHVLSKGADVNYRDGSVHTPLLCAVQFNKNDVALKLLQRGADPTIESGELFCQLAERNNTQILKAVIDKGAQPIQDTLERAIWRGHIDAAQLIIEGGVAVHTQAVMLASASKSSAEAMELCVKHGGQPREALEQLKANENLYRYGERAKMIQALEAYVSSAPSVANNKPQGFKP